MEQQPEAALPADIYYLELAPDEFNELISTYENYYEWCSNDLDERARRLAERVLAKLRQADADHVCVDDES